MGKTQIPIKYSVMTFMIIVFSRVSLPSVQMLLLAHLYAKTDSASLATLRGTLLRKRFTAAEVSVGVGMGLTATAGPRGSST